MKIYYNPKLKAKARELRNNPTFSEKILWKHLQSSQLKGYAFLRQKPIDEYIVDFYCTKLQLVIEIDGESHNGKQSYDQNREKKLRSLGLNIIRMDGHYVIKDTTGALLLILKKIEEIEKHPPSPLF